MGLGGYCTLDYLHLVEHMVGSMSPDLVIVGCYFGNDFLECQTAVYRQGRYARFRADDAVGTAEEKPVAPAGSTISRVRGWLSGNSMLYGLLKSRLRNYVHWQESLQQARGTNADDMMVWKDPSRLSIQTILTPRWRLQALDPDSADVREGKRLAEEAFRAMHASLAAKGIPLLVVFIPTKELVYRPFVEQDPGVDVPRSLSDLWMAEEDARESLRTFLEREGIPVVDALPALRQRLESGTPVYPLGFDGHPVAAGYAAIADAALGHPFVNHAGGTSGNGEQP